MGPARTWAVIALLGPLCTSACAALTGLGDLQEVESVGDAGGDATAGDAPAPHDAPLPPHDAPPPPVDAFVLDAGADATPPEVDAGTDAPVDVGVDAPVDVGIDAPPVDCGTTNTVANCTACGLSCDQGVSLDAGCNGATCTYAGCLVGHANCDTSAPDTNGCECATPGCCQNACEDSHHNGVGQFFYDCVSPGTINPAQAKEACEAFTKDATKCNVVPCDDAGDTAMCSTATKTTCICWAFAGAGGGRVAEGVTGPDGGNEICQCPTAGTPLSWN